MIILSHTIPSRELADLPIPIVTIEREDQFVSSINTDNYMGGYQAASLLAKHDCDILLHINSPTDPKIPSYGRIQGFLDCCREQNLRHEMIFREFGHSYETVQPLLQKIIEETGTKVSRAEKRHLCLQRYACQHLFKSSLPDIRPPAGRLSPGRL